MPLSPGQAHHLVNVVRIFKKRRRGRGRRIAVVDDDKRDNDDRGGGGGDGDANNDDGGWVRIFNGNDGEWLARVVRAAAPTPPPDATIQGRGSRRTPSSGGGRRGGSRGGDEPLAAECVALLRAQDRSSDGERPWVLFVPLKKRHRTRAMIEKCTEIGAGRMMPIASDRMEGDASCDDDGDGHSGAGAGDATARLEDKLGLISIEAAEQCERLDVPAIARDAALSAWDDDGGSPSPPSRGGGGGGGGGMWTVRDFLPRWCRDWEGGGGVRGVGGGGGGVSDVAAGGEDAGRRRRVLLVCRERGGSGSTDGGGAVVPVLRALRGNDRVAFLVGPEGGWSAEEELFFDEICSGYGGGGGGDDAPVRCVSLGPSVLRAETACMVAVAAWALANDSAAINGETRRKDEK